MEIQAIEIEGFRSFGPPQELVFEDNPPGLFFMTGENRAEPELEANGAGKSTLCEALLWVLRGNVSLNAVNSPDLKHWTYSGPMRVALDVKLPMGVEYTIERSWNPNKLLLNDEQIDQPTLDALIKMPSLVGLYNSLTVGQFTASFLDLTQAQKGDFISSVLSLDALLGYSDRAGEIERSLGQDLVSIERRVASSEAVLESLYDRLASDKEQHAQWWEETQRKIAVLKEDIELAQKKEKELADQERIAREAMRELEEERKDIDEAFGQDSSKLGRVQRKIGQLQNDRSALQGKLQAAEEAFSRVDLDQCPSCLQKVDRKHIDVQRRKTDTVVDSLKQDIQEIEESLAEQQAIEQRLDEDCSEREDHLGALDEEIESKRTVALEAREEIKQLQQGVTRYFRQLTELEDGASPHAIAMEEGKAKISQERQALAKHIRQRRAREREKRIYGHCRKMFKDIRLDMLEYGLNLLQIESNNVLHDIGLPGWQFFFNSEVENKSGGIKRGVSVLVKSPESKDRVPWEVWSGGERQRLKMAVTLAISNLVQSHTDAFNIEIWDEPSSWMSRTGVFQLLEVLRERAIRQQKQVWVIDHRSLEFGGFEGYLTVIKEQEGSRFEFHG